MNLIWFRNDLRTKDNHSLIKALGTGDPVLGLYCFDPEHYKEDQFGFKKTEKFRAQFLIETVTELSENLGKLNIPLLVYTDKPQHIIPDLAKKYNIKSVFLQKEWTREEIMILEQVKEQSGMEQVDFIETYDQFLFHPEDIPYDDFDSIPKIFTEFRKKCERNSEVRRLAKEPKAQEKQSKPEDLNQIPALKDLGLETFERDSRTAFPFRGGENQGLKRIEEYFWETEKLKYYKKTRNGLVGRDYSSKLSPWLANGSLSPRTIYWEVKRFEKEKVENDSTYWLIFELIWRDFFKYVSLKHGSKIFKIGGILDKKYEWGSNEEARNRWIEGQTKYDFVNANMKEIAATGWMSNRGRQNVASFWAKELKQDWRIGAAYFESLLLDYDVHSNYGNWMYNSGVGNDPRDRKFNIQSQADRYDENGKFRRLWLQENLF